MSSGFKQSNPINLSDWDTKKTGSRQQVAVTCMYGPMLL